MSIVIPLFIAQISRALACLPMLLFQIVLALLTYARNRLCGIAQRGWIHLRILKTCFVIIDWRSYPFHCQIVELAFIPLFDILLNFEHVFAASVGALVAERVTDVSWFVLEGLTYFGTFFGQLLLVDCCCGRGWIVVLADGFGYSLVFIFTIFNRMRLLILRNLVILNKSTIIQICRWLNYISLSHLSSSLRACYDIHFLLILQCISNDQRWPASKAHIIIMVQK